MRELRETVCYLRFSVRRQIRGVTITADPKRPSAVPFNVRLLFPDENGSNFLPLRFCPWARTARHAVVCSHGLALMPTSIGPELTICWQATEDRGHSVMSGVYKRFETAA